MKLSVNKRSQSPTKIKPLQTSSVSFGDKVTPVIDFLKHNYRIEINRYDRTQMRIASTGTKIYTFPPSVDDISLHMMQEGIPHTRTLIKMLLNSPNHIAAYDPIMEYFKSLEAITPAESHIDRLLSHIKVREWGDRTDGFYTNNAAKYIRKWLASAAACATTDFANEAALLFISEREGNGKTSLARFLCPPELHDMSVISSADRRAFSLEQAVVSNFMVLYDEMNGLTPSVAEEYKMALSARQLSVKMRGDFCPIVRPRIGSVIGTSNNRIGHRYGCLHPALGTRRFIPIYIDEIDFDYIDNVDINMVWAEALALSRDQQYNHSYTQEDFEELHALNQRYIIDTPASTMLQHVYRASETSDQDIVWLNASEILADLQERHLIKSDMVKYFTPKHIGEAMTQLGFERQMIYGNGDRLYRYCVTRL